MIKPSEIKAVSERFREENYKFRTYLKNRADSDELDENFLYLHNELFADYDCDQCNNCCKEYTTVFEDEEIQAASRLLGMSEADFVSAYLTETDEGSETKEKPCVFLCEDGKCRIEQCMPSSCRDFPFTDRPDRLSSMLGVVEFAEACPVVFEILQRLKKIYRFRGMRY
jgi:Fe-S-cluster containining protein